MTFANPIMLWSLVGLAVPIAIHLLSRKEGQIIRLGSIRHLQETSTQQFKGIKLNELLLLALRCLLVFIFCLLLSGLRCAGISTQKWIVIEPGFENNLFVQSMVDSLETEGYERHFLCEGFPTIDNSNASSYNYWALVEQLNEKNLSAAVVLSSNKFVNFRGERTSLPSNIKWIEVPPEKVDFIVEAIQLNSDTTYVRNGHSSSDQTFFTTDRTTSPSKSIPISMPDSVRITIVVDEDFKYDLRILTASLKAIQEKFPINMKVVESTSSSYAQKNSDWCFWLSNSKSSENDSVLTITLRPRSSDRLIERVGPRTWNFTKRLDEGIALDKNLTLRLAELIVPSKKQQEIASVNDVRTMPDSLAWSRSKKMTSAGAISAQVDGLLLFCLIVLLLAERIIAYRRNQ